MTATFAFSQSNTVSQTKTDIGSGGGTNDFNFQSADVATPATYTTNVITAGNDSFEVYLQGHFTGTFNTITNLKFWNSTQSLTGYGTGASIKASVKTAAQFATPTATPNADSAVPTVEGSALAPTYPGSNFSDYVRLQLHTAADATPGDGGTNTFTLKYDET